MSKKKNNDEENTINNEELESNELEENKDKEVKENFENENEKIKELNDKYLRLFADFDNFKKRTIKEKTEISNYAVSNFIEGLLPIIDNLERALEAKDHENSKFYEGIEMIYNQLMEVLSKNSVEKITDENDKFDPIKHHGVMIENHDDIDDDIVIKCLQPGYMFKEKVIRPAMVIVNKK